MSATRVSEEQDRAAIADVLVRYATAIDRRDWTLFRTCFTEDCTADYGEIGTWSSADELTAIMTKFHTNMGHTLHRITNVAVSIDGPAATARSYVHVVLQLDASNPKNVYETFGFYDDTLVRTSDDWRVSTRTFTTVAERMF